MVSSAVRPAAALSCLVVLVAPVSLQAAAAGSGEGVIEAVADVIPESTKSFWQSIVEQELGGFLVGDLLLSFGIILFALLFRNLLTKIVFTRLAALASRTKTDYDDRVLDALTKPTAGFVVVVGIYVSILVLPVSLETYQLSTTVFQGVSMFFLFWGIMRFIDVVADILEEISDERDLSIGGFVPLIKKAIRAFIIVIGAVMVIDNLGYSVGGVLAAMGLGGAALAFAAKDTIANLYGSIALALDRPFKVGDWIMVGNEVDGDVESIGLRSTRVRTWPKTLMSIPNSVLANEVINNWSAMPKRRVKQVVGVTYESSPDDMEGIVQDIRDLLAADDGVQQDFILVNFTDFGESSLDILVYYFTTTTKWLEHMDVRQRVNVKIMRAVEARGLSVAFPTRTLYLEGDVAKGLGGRYGLPDSPRLPGDAGPTEPR